MGSYHLIHLWAILAVLATGLFAGAVLHVLVAEHPARMACATPVALAQWRASVRQAVRVLPAYALLGTLFGVLTWWGDGGVLFLIAAALLGAVIPFRWIAFRPVIRKLMAETLDPAAAPTRELLKVWGRLHAVRVVLSAAALVLMLVQSLWVWGE
jgi:hypothetical protein